MRDTKRDTKGKTLSCDCSLFVCSNALTCLFLHLFFPYPCLCLCLCPPCDLRAHPKLKHHVSISLAFPYFAPSSLQPYSQPYTFVYASIFSYFLIFCTMLSTHSFLFSFFSVSSFLSFGTNLLLLFVVVVGFWSSASLVPVVEKVRHCQLSVHVEKCS